MIKGLCDRGALKQQQMDQCVVVQVAAGHEIPETQPLPCPGSSSKMIGGDAQSVEIVPQTQWNQSIDSSE